MTREEKIKGLYSLKEYLIENPIELEGHKSLPITLIDYAIEALEQEPTTKNDLGVDYISRDDVLKIMRVNQLIHDGEWAMRLSMNEIKDLPSILPQNPKWIPVTERLPEEKGLYLVSVKNDHNRRYSKTCWFHGGDNWFARQDVLAWMPLPQPYKAESEDKE